MTKLNVTEDFLSWVDVQSPERMEVAQNRAKKREGEYWDDNSLLDVTIDELKLMYVADTTAELAEQGVIEGRVGADGEIRYYPVEED